MEYVQTDVIARYHRLLGEEVYFLSGTDENAQKNVISAKAHGFPVQAWVDAKSAEFQQLLDALEISYSGFIRTSNTARHWPGVKLLWSRVFERGDIYSQTYRGQYCVGCEAFLSPKDLVNGSCPEHLVPPEKIEEVNYFFRLSRYQAELDKIIATDIVQIIPDTRKNEIIAFIREGLQDFSISRPAERLKGWGIPVPNDPSQIIYVWFDALVNYISALGYGTDVDLLFRRFWPANLHVIGKGIIRFHAVYWLAMLLSAGLPIPKKIFVHGYVTVENQKMSKSLGNMVDPQALCHKFGVDTLRYALISTISPFNDGNFSEHALIDRNNQDLVGVVGNFCYRTLSFIDRFFKGVIPPFSMLHADTHTLDQEIADVANRVKAQLDQCKLRDALQEIVGLAAVGNKYFQEHAPWVSIKNDIPAARNVLGACAELCRVLCLFLHPFIPRFAKDLWQQLGTTEPLEKCTWGDIHHRGKVKGQRIITPTPLIKKIMDK